MFQKLKAKFLNLNLIVNYRKILPYVKPYWGRALTAVLITIPIGSMDAVIAWALKPYMDVVMVEKYNGLFNVFDTAVDNCIQPAPEPADVQRDIFKYLGRPAYCHGC